MLKIQLDAGELALADLYLSAALVAIGFKIARVVQDRISPGRHIFVFAPAPGLEQAQAAYYGGELSIPDALRFGNAVRLLKARIHQSA